MSLANEPVKKEPVKLCVNNRLYGKNKEQKKCTESNKQWLQLGNFLWQAMGKKKEKNMSVRKIDSDEDF